MKKIETEYTIENLCDINALKSFIGWPRNKKLNCGFTGHGHDYLKTLGVGIYIDDPVFVGDKMQVPPTLLMIGVNPEGFYYAKACDLPKSFLDKHMGEIQCAKK